MSDDTCCLVFSILSDLQGITMRGGHEEFCLYMLNVLCPCKAVILHTSRTSYTDYALNWFATICTHYQFHHWPAVDSLKSVAYGQLVLGLKLDRGQPAEFMGGSGRSRSCGGEAMV